MAAANVANTDAVTQLLAQTSPTIILGTKNLAEALSGHEQIVYAKGVPLMLRHNYTAHLHKDQQSLPPPAPSATPTPHKRSKSDKRKRQDCECSFSEQGHN